MSGAISCAPTSVRGRFLVRDASTHLVTAEPSNRARLEGLLGPQLLAAPNLEGCVLRLLLMPCARTRDVLRRILPHSVQWVQPAAPKATWLAGSQRLAPVVAMHVRLGDAYIVHGPGRRRSASRLSLLGGENLRTNATHGMHHHNVRLQQRRFAQNRARATRRNRQHTSHTPLDREHGRRLGFMPWDIRDNQFVKAPVSSMACLLNAASSAADFECLHPAVVADAPIVEACARRVLLDNVTLTPGTAAFVNVDLDGDDAGYLKVMLDRGGCSPLPRASSPYRPQASRRPPSRFEMRPPPRVGLFTFVRN